MVGPTSGLHPDVGPSLGWSPLLSGYWPSNAQLDAFFFHPVQTTKKTIKLRDDFRRHGAQVTSCDEDLAPQIQISYLHNEVELFLSLGFGPFQYQKYINIICKYIYKNTFLKCNHHIRNYAASHHLNICISVEMKLAILRLYSSYFSVVQCALCD